MIRSPGFRVATASAICAEVSTGFPSIATIVSPPIGMLTPFIVTSFLAARSPAFAAGLPLSTRSTITPRSGIPRTTLATVGSIVTSETPSQACWAWPLASSCWTTERAVSDGIAKPTPTFAFTVPLWICAAIPTTRPSRSRSGPPEFPWLIGASVWIAFGMVRPFGDSMSRPTALTMPAVIVRSSPNGLPIA